MHIEIKIDDTALTHTLEQLRALGKDSTPIMRELAGIMAGAAEDAFDTQRDPVTGAPWQPLAASTIAARQASGHDGKILQLSGSLASSLERRYGADFAIVGTNKEYAAIHQFGGKTKAHRIAARFKRALKIPGVGFRKSVNHPGSSIPARSFLGVGEEDLEEMREAALRALEKAVQS